MTNQLRLQKTIATSLLVVLFFMPFHAFLSVWLGHLTGHEIIWQSWKEVLLLITLTLAGVLVWCDRTSQINLMQTIPKLIFLYILLGLFISAVAKPNLSSFVYGVKTDYEFLVAFILAFVVSSPKLHNLATRVVIIGGSVVGVFGTLQALVLSKDFLSNFGYGPATIQPYENITAQVASYRILSTLGGPNQLGSYLILPICLLIYLMFKKFQWWQPLVLLTCLISLWHTYSRSAWLAIFAAIGITIAIEVPKAWRLKLFVAIVISLFITVLTLGFNLGKHQALQSYLLHGSLNSYSSFGSDAQRLQSQQHGLALIANNPVGRGLGTAGPASKHGYNYVITENYYLQIAIELGVIGLVIFIAIEVATAQALWKLRRYPGASAALGALAGISLINFFLHGWADSSTALIYWIYAGLLIGAYAKLKTTRQA